MPTTKIPDAVIEKVADAVLEAFISPNVHDRNLESANVVDVIDKLASAVRSAAHAILPAGTAPGHDATGGTIDSLTEAVMGVTAGLCKIADSISDLAQAVREGQSNL